MAYEPGSSIVRRISRFVMRHASPSSKEWAEGLAREADFVESDWKALAWSLGSMRVLFSYREAPLRSFAELTKAAEKYAEAKRQSFGTTNAQWISNLGQTLSWSVCFFLARSWQDRIGYFLLTLGYVPIDNLHTNPKPQRARRAGSLRSGKA